MEGELILNTPIKLSPVFKERIWGGTKLSEFNYSLPSEKTGEAWLLCDHKEGSNLPLIDSSYMGKKAFSDKTGRLNLLIKLLNSQDDLSIQVHPSNNYYRLDKTELGKAEVWYVLSAEKDSKIIYGLSESSTLESLTNAIKNDIILLETNEIKVNNGDIIYIPPGTVHALGKGIVVVEIQQNSDTTFRLYDYNRIDSNGNLRPLHIEQSLEVIDFNQNKPIIKKSDLRLDIWTTIEKNEFFTVEEILLIKKFAVNTFKDCFTFILCLDGEGQIIWDNISYSIKKGESFILPCGEKTYSLNTDNRIHILRSYIE